MENPQRAWGVVWKGEDLEWKAGDALIVALALLFMI